MTPSLRFWGEEKVEGAVYNIFLKKVRYHPSSSINEDDEPDGIAHLEWETVKLRLIKGGTIEKLIDSLASENGELDTSFLTIFMSTFRTFASVSQVLKTLLLRWVSTPFNYFFKV
ncbi:Ral guanine nucleotide dissociation stimulator-like 1 [Nymphon striatum]|nr:Ral guanine nucleotide dissociation stimulator-like 1 [Nymphon striatum]